MPYKHVGVRPKHPVAIPTDKTKAHLRYETLPDGGKRIWTKRMLKSGCDYELSLIQTLGSSLQSDRHDLMYCPNCQEYFSMDQFIKVEETDDEQE